MATKTSTGPVVIARPNKITLDIPVIGITPLIMHKWSEKAKRQMLNTQRGRKAAREPRDPRADYEATIYRTHDGAYGFPVLAFKAAAVRAGKLLGLKMTDVRQLISVEGVTADDGDMQLTPIEGEPRMREDVCHVGTGTDLRYRAEFPVWATTLTVNFYSAMISEESVLTLFEMAGDTVGVGEWRPEKDGDFGRFQIDDKREIIAR